MAARLRRDRDQEYQQKTYIYLFIWEHFDMATKMKCISINDDLRIGFARSCDEVSGCWFVILPFFTHVVCVLPTSEVEEAAEKESAARILVHTNLATIPLC